MRVSAAAADASSADAYLCHLGRSIADALRSVTAKVVAARAQLRSTCAALLSAVNSRCDELEERVVDAGSSKIAALERELCAVDAALEIWRSERGAAADAEFSARHAELTARFDAAEAKLLALPTTILEPPHIGFIVDAPALLASIAACGQVIAPRAITAADLTLERMPSFAQPGRTLHLHLVRQPTPYSFQSAEELEVSLGAAAAATHVEATLEAPGAAPQHLQTDVRVDLNLHRVVVSCSIPLDAPPVSSVRIGSIRPILLACFPYPQAVPHVAQQLLACFPSHTSTCRLLRPRRRAGAQPARG